MKLTDNPYTIQSHKTNKIDNTDHKTFLCSLSINLKIKNSDDKCRKLNYENKKEKKNSQQAILAARSEGLIAPEGAE